MNRIIDVCNRFKNFNRFEQSEEDKDFIYTFGLEMAKAIYLDCGEDLTREIAWTLTAFLKSNDIASEKRNHKSMCNQ